jgi:two-component system NtrC family response regulator
MEKPAVLIIDDDEDIRTQLQWAIASDYEVTAAEDRPAALVAFAEKKPDVVLLDLGLPPFPGDSREGFSALAELLAIEPRTKIIIISGQGDRANALRAIGEGAYDFLAKPVDIDELKTILRRAAHVARLERDYAAVRETSASEAMFEDMLGQSTQMQQVFGSIRKLAATSAPVLILGESGTGKEMAALAIHRRSSRKDGPFVAINCGAIPENLIESELFGHERGSFTGAHTQRPGKIEGGFGRELCFSMKSVSCRCCCK